MSTTGYSGTPLAKKLGITPRTKLRVINAPANYYDLIETNVDAQPKTNSSAADVIHLFVTSNASFEKEMRSLKKIIEKNPAVVIWVSWYKKAAKIPTDVTEDVIRNYALKNDLVDVKVCAVSEVWSGLKLVVPLAKR